MPFFLENTGRVADYLARWLLRTQEMNFDAQWTTNIDIADEDLLSPADINNGHASSSNRECSSAKRLSRDSFFSEPSHEAYPLRRNRYVQSFEGREAPHSRCRASDSR